MDLNNYEESSSSGKSYRRSQSNNHAVISKLHSDYMNSPGRNFHDGSKTDMNKKKEEDISHRFTNSPVFNFGSYYEMDSNEGEASMLPHKFPSDLSFNSVINDFEMKGPILSSDCKEKCNFAHKSGFLEHFKGSDSLTSIHNITNQFENNNSSSSLLDSGENVKYERISTILNSDTVFKGIKISSSSDENKQCDFYPASNCHKACTLEDPLLPRRKDIRTQNIFFTSARDIYDKCGASAISSKHIVNRDSEVISCETENPLSSTSKPDTESNSQTYLNKNSTRGVENLLASNVGFGQNQNVCPATNDKSFKPIQPCHMTNKSSESTSNDLENPFPNINNVNEQEMEHPPLSMRRFSWNQNVCPATNDKSLKAIQPCHMTNKSSESTSNDLENPFPNINNVNEQEMEHPPLSMRRFSWNQNVCPATNDKSFKAIQPCHMTNNSSESTSNDLENPFPNINEDNIGGVRIGCLPLIMGRNSQNKNICSGPYEKLNVPAAVYSESISYGTEHPLPNINNVIEQEMEHPLSMRRFSWNQNVCPRTSVYDEFKVPALPSYFTNRSSNSASYETENPLPTMRNTSVHHELSDKVVRQKSKIVNDALKRSMMQEQSKVTDFNFKSKLDKNLARSKHSISALGISFQGKNIAKSSVDKGDSSSSSSSSSKSFCMIQNIVPVSNYDISKADIYLKREEKTNASSNSMMVPSNGEYQILPVGDHVQSLAHASDLEQHKMTEDSNTDLVVLAVYWRKGFLGAAYYSSDTTEIHVTPDIVDVNPEFNILHSLYTLVQPSKVIVPAQMPEIFLSALKSLTGYDTPADVQSLRLEKKLHILPRKEYNLEGCRRRVLLLKLPSEPEECNEDEHLLYLNSLIDMTNESMTQALGVLLKWLDMSWGHMHLEQQKQPPIMAINILSLKDLVMIDRDTYEALQIFSPRPHPSGFKRGMPGTFREGLSVFGIFNRCKSPIGCKHMRVMLRHPSRNIDVLNARLDVVQFCLHPNNEDIVGNMIVCLKNIKSVTRILSRLTRLSASIQEWKSLHKTIYYSLLLGTLCEQFSAKIKLFAEIAGSVTDEMQQIEYSITKILDFKESEKQNSFVVNVGVDEALDRKKQEYGGIPNLMTSVAHQELDNLPSYINECSLVYIPEIGYLLAIFAWKETMTNKDWEVPGMEFMFKLGQIGHYKSARCRELDEMLGDILIDIMKLESQILLRLVQFIQQRITPLHKLINKAAELDCLIALSSVARENNYCRPELTMERILEIKEGRHPLQELCVDNFVPNDTLSSDDYTLMKIITGPNSSGKSVYLKQVALIAYLAHIGSFVPAAVARIGILDHIHTRIQTVESVAINISAFVIDLKQMLLSLYNSTPSSLIIVDEFGKGTTEIDGLALLASCLDHFLSREEKCPHVLAATHFHNIKNLIRESKYLKFQTMECLFVNDQQVVNLFKLKEGSIETSCALAIAQTILGTATGARAEKFLDAVKNGKEISVPANSEMHVKAAKYKALAQKILTTDSSDDNQIEELNRLCNKI